MTTYLDVYNNSRAKLNIYFNGQKVKTVGKYEHSEFEINEVTDVQGNYGFFAKSECLKIIPNGNSKTIRADKHFLIGKCIFNGNEDSIPSLLQSNNEMLPIIVLSIIITAFIIFIGPLISDGGSDNCAVCGGSGLVNEGFINFRSCPVCGGSGTDFH